MKVVSSEVESVLEQEAAFMLSTLGVTQPQ